MWKLNLMPTRTSALPEYYVSAGATWKAYLACLLFQSGKLLDRRIDVRLKDLNDVVSKCTIILLPLCLRLCCTFASSSASGISWSASFEKSFSGFSAPSDIFAGFLDCVCLSENLSKARPTERN